MPNQPWSDIRGMGNRLRHAYDRLDLGDLLPLLAADARHALVQLRGSTNQ
jgi:uncharacterized protein with HEPN domain